MPLVWRVELSPHAARAFKKLDKPVRAAIATRLTDMVAELDAGKTLTALTANVKKLVGSDPAEWRLRVGDYRVRFRTDVQTIEPRPGEDDVPLEEGVVVVTRLGHRRDVYRD